MEQSFKRNYNKGEKVVVNVKKTIMWLTGAGPQLGHDGEVDDGHHGDGDDAGQRRARDEVERVR